MKKFNQLTEKQMSQTNGGFIFAAVGLLATIGLATAVAVPVGISKTK